MFLQKNEKIILYLGSGSMSGVFGAGVLSFLAEKNCYDKIEAIYATSVGVANAAYFLTRDTKKASIYFEDLAKNFIFPYRAPLGIAQLFWSRFIREIPQEKSYHVVDIDYFMEVVRKIKPLDVKKLVAQPTPLFVNLLNAESGEPEYLDIRQFEPLATLRAAICVKPYFGGAQKINGRFYIDGNLKEYAVFEHLLKKYPRNKIVLVFNEPLERRARSYFYNFLAGAVSALYKYSFSLYSAYLKRERMTRKAIDCLLQEKRVIITAPPILRTIRPYTSAAKKLAAAFELGKKEAAAKIMPLFG